MYNIPKSTTVEQLRNAFLSFGTIADVFIPTSGHRVKEKCFGLVHFLEEKKAIEAMEATNGSFFGGRKMTVNIAKYGRANKRKEDQAKHQNKENVHSLPQRPIVELQVKGETRETLLRLLPQQERLTTTASI